MDTGTEVPRIEWGRTIEASFAGLDAVHALLDEYWSLVEDDPIPVPDTTWRSLFDSAVAEIAGNIVRHSYVPPCDFSAPSFHLSLRCFSDRMEALLLDAGIPYVLTLQPSRTSPDMRDALDNIDLEHGWGLPIAHAATDGLDYQRMSDGHNRWQICKRFPS